MTGPSPALEEEALVVWGLLRAAAGFGKRSIGRHRRRFAVVVAATLCTCALALWALPRTWHVEAKILAQRNQVMPALGNPSRTVPREADAPTRAAADTMLSRDNLVALVKQTDLLDRWESARAPAVRLKDRLSRLVRAPATEEDQLEALVGLLEKRLKVEADDSSVSVSIDWPDAQMAHRLVEAAQQSFIESRHVAEVSVIAEAISILESHDAGVRKELDQALADLGRRAEQPAQAPRRRLSMTTVNHDSPPEAGRLAVQLAAKKRALADLEDFRTRRLEELQGQLTEARATFAETHPTVLGLRGSLEALSRPSPQVLAQRREVERLRDEWQRAGGVDQASAGGLSERARAQVEATSRALEPQRASADPGLQIMRERLDVLLRKHDSLQERIDGAQIELDTARAAFKYRYSVVKPAVLPKKASKPNPVLFAVGGLLGGLLLAFLACVGADLRGGKIEEAWQAQRLLELPLLGELDAP